jgi:hypothetical protein
MSWAALAKASASAGLSSYVACRLRQARTFCDEWAIVDLLGQPQRLLKIGMGGAVLAGIEEHPSRQACELGRNRCETATLILTAAVGEKPEHIPQLGDDSGTQRLTTILVITLPQIPDGRL